MRSQFANVEAATRRRMSRVRHADTSAELTLRAALRRAGVHYRIGGKGIPGRPDVHSKSRRVAVFVDGCFWHGCPTCDDRPKVRTEFWNAKFEYNQKRRERVRTQLAEMGWRVVEVWEHELRDDADAVAARVAPFFLG